MSLFGLLLLRAAAQPHRAAVVPAQQEPVAAAAPTRVRTPSAPVPRRPAAPRRAPARRAR